jgi:ribosomal protein S18 acetylase RimI-like enzyme
MDIRPFSESDRPAVIDLWREVFPTAPAWNDPEEDIRRKLAVQRDLFLVAIRGSDVVGTAMGGYDGHRGWIYYVAVSPAQRRQGIGTALLLELEKRLVRIGCPKVNLQVRAPADEGVASFYEGLGYGVEERISLGKRLPQA